MTISEKDKNYIWHPYTQMQNHLPIIPIASAKGSLLIAEDGTTYIDAISSWWTNIHGHAHPHIAKAITHQAQQLEHTIFAGFTHAPASNLAERLIGLLPNNQKKVFYSDNGSTAVEVALKMTIQYWHNQNRDKKILIAFEGAYHGDTFGAMSVSDRSSFTKPFDHYLFDIKTIPVPIKGKEQDSLSALQNIITEHKDKVAGFIFEPLLQGTAGMVMYEAAILDQLIKLCQNHHIICIADEVLTGFGRTGKLFASDYLHEKVDIICLSKGITGGFLPLGVTTCNEKIFNAFLSEDKLKTLFHGHSYTANPIVCAAAIANLEVFEQENTLEKIKHIKKQHEAFVQSIEYYVRAENVRILGSIIALDITVGGSSYFNEVRDTVYKFALEQGVLLRPLGHVVYIMPPYCISDEELAQIYSTIRKILLNLER
jgi:adenosylmethionine---8-amino-7-oxononanoate aminotransferase